MSLQARYHGGRIIHSLFSISQDGYREIDFPPFIADSRIFDLGASVTTEDYVYFTACSQLESVTCQVLAANETTAEALIEYSEIDGPLYSRPRDLVQYGGSVYFVAHAGSSPTHHSAYLHRIDGTTVTRTTQRVSDVFASEDIGILLRHGSRLLTIDELGNFVELVTQDSSPIITDLKKAFVHDGKIYFNTPDNELYAFDGTQVTKSADDPVNLNYTFAFSTQSTPEGIFYSSRDRQMGWTDGVSKVHIFDGLTRYSNSGGVFANGAYFFHGEDETGPGLFKIVRSNSIARVDVNANGIVDVHDIDQVARSIRDGSDESGVFDFKMTDRLILLTTKS